MSQQPHEVIWSLTNAVIPSASLHAIAELGVADLIAEESVPLKQLASGCGVDAESLDRVMSLLAAHDIFEREQDGYRHTDASRLLRRDHPMSMRAFARMMALPVMKGSFDRLDHSLRTGSTSFELVGGAALWPYLAAHPDEREIFGQAMTAKAETWLLTSRPPATPTRSR